MCGFGIYPTTCLQNNSEDQWDTMDTEEVTRLVFIPFIGVFDSLGHKHYMPEIRTQ